MCVERFEHTQDLHDMFTWTGVIAIYFLTVAQTDKTHTCTRTSNTVRFQSKTNPWRREKVLNGHLGLAEHTYCSDLCNLLLSWPAACSLLQKGGHAVFSLRGTSCSTTVGYVVSYGEQGYLSRAPSTPLCQMGNNVLRIFASQMESSSIRSSPDAFWLCVCVALLKEL